MSKINTIRIVNLHYNHNFNHIDDLIIDCQGANTLINLTNGGGKSTLIQLITALFVHKRYRNVNQGGKDRPFGDFFLSGHRPSFIMVEWLKDHNMGKVLTGTMVYRPNNKLDQKDLQMLNFIAEYDEDVPYDLRHLPIIEMTSKGEKQPVTYSKGKDLLLRYRKNHKMSVFDMNENFQARKYFDALDENKIPPKEWETIIHKINEDESGVTRMFSSCTSSQELLKKVLLPTVEEKLNSDHSYMSEFQDMCESYVAQCYENAAKIENNKKAALFTTDLAEIQSHVDDYIEKSNRCDQQLGSLLAVKKAVDQRLEALKKELSENAQAIEEIVNQIDDLAYEEMSYKYYLANDDYLQKYEELQSLKAEKEKQEEKSESLKRTIRLLECAKAALRVEDANHDYLEAVHESEYAKKDQAPLEKEHDALGSRLKDYYQDQISETKEEVLENKEATRAQNEQKKTLERNLAQVRKTIRQQEKQITSLETKQKEYDGLEDKYNRNYQASLKRRLSGTYEEGLLESTQDQVKKSLKDNETKRFDIQDETAKTQVQITRLEKKNQDAQKELVDLHVKDNEVNKLIEKLKQEKEERLTILRYLGMESDDVYENEKILNTLEDHEHACMEKEEALMLEIDGLNRQINKLESGHNLIIPDGLKELMDAKDIPYIYGGEWLKKSNHTKEENEALIKAHPFLPYAIILYNKDIRKLEEALKGQEAIYSDEPIPIVSQESLKNLDDHHEGLLYHMGETSFYMLFNDRLLIEEELEKALRSLESKRSDKKRRLHDVREDENRAKDQKHTISSQLFSKKEESRAYKKQEETQKKLAALQKEISETSRKITHLKETLESLRKELVNLEFAYKDLQRQCSDLEDLMDAYRDYLKRRVRLEDYSKENERLESVLSEDEEALEDVQETLQSLSEEAVELKTALHDLQREASVFASYEDHAFDESVMMIFDEMYDRFKALDQHLSSKRKDLQERLNERAKRLENEETNLEELESRYHLAAEDYQDMTYSLEKISQATNDREALEVSLKSLETSINEAERTTGSLENRKNTQLRRIESRFAGKEPKERNLIAVRDFKKENEQLHASQGQLEQAKENLETHQKNFEHMASSLEIYHENSHTPVITLEEGFMERQDDLLMRDTAVMKDDYETLKNDKNEQLTSLVDLYYANRAKPEYTEGIFIKCLNRIGSSLEDAKEQDNAQLIAVAMKRITEGFNQFVDALQATMNMLDREKDDHVEQLYNYAYKLYEEINKIDSHSTITIFDKPTKMMRIVLPRWVNETDDDIKQSIYYARVKQFYENLIEDSLKVHDQEVIGESKKTLHEYVKTHLTSETLFASTVDLNDLDIKITKVGTQTTIVISWQEAATKSSDGETFLTSFIVLASLLYYMRYNDTDLYATKNDGKVLIMDNPFGKASAKHLLKPMMDIARKNNIQLISLTAHDDDTIRSCYDNIYVLKLQPSAFNPDHKKLISTEEVHKGIDVTMEGSHLTITDLETDYA